MRLVLIIILLIIVIGALPSWPYSTGWGVGYWPSGGAGFVLLVFLILILLGVL